MRKKIVAGIALAALAAFPAHAVTGPFANDLRQGAVGPEVRALQAYLNAYGFALAVSGPGSPGFETSYFGPLTRAAVTRLQERFASEILAPLGLLRGTGNFFVSTRTWVNRMLAGEIATTTAAVPDASTTIRSGSARNGSRPEHAVTPSASHATVSPSGIQTVPAGTTQAFTVQPDAGYRLPIAVSGTCPAGSWAGNVYTTAPIAGPCSVSFSPTPITYAVTLDGPGISPSGVTTVAFGAPATFTVTTGVGYGLGSVTGTCPAGSWVHATYESETLAEDCALSFSPGSVGPVGATITASGTIYLRQNGNAFEYSLDGSAWSVSMMPQVTNIGPGTLTVRLVGDFTLRSNSSSLVAGSDNIVFQGETGPAGPTVVTVDDVSNYNGFVQNGTAVSQGYDNVAVRDVFVNAAGSTLAPGAGWIGQAYFGNGASGNEISSCGSNGPISDFGGGIVGEHAEGVAVSGCFSTGAIANGAGGIVGMSADDVTVTDSYATGAIGTNAGGIVGSLAGNIVATNVYTTGAIESGGGGIAGPVPGGPLITHAYAAGASARGRSGGIISGSALDGFANYSEANNGSSGWNATNAAAVLTGVGSTWREAMTGAPYWLGTFDASPYADASQEVAPGGSGSAAYGYYGSFAIVGITGGSPGSYGGIGIDGTTGAVSVAAGVAPGTYDLLVRCESLHGTYSLSALELTVR